MYRAVRIGAKGDGLPVRELLLAIVLGALVPAFLSIAADPERVRVMHMFSGAAVVVTSLLLVAMFASLAVCTLWLSARDAALVPLLFVRLSRGEVTIRTATGFLSRRSLRVRAGDQVAYHFESKVQTPSLTGEGRVLYQWSLSAGGQRLPVRTAYRPGSEQVGVLGRTLGDCGVPLVTASHSD